MRKIGVALFALLVSACATQPRNHAGIRDDVTSADQCTSIAGWWTLEDKKEVCITLPTDAGRRCKDDSECQTSICLAPFDALREQPSAGSCASGVIKDNCLNHIRSGIVTSGHCIVR